MDWWSDNCWIVIDLWSKAWLVYAAVSLYRRYSRRGGGTFVRAKFPRLPISFAEMLLAQNPAIQKSTLQFYI